MEHNRCDSSVREFLNFVMIFAVAAMSALVGYHYGAMESGAASYIERCQTMRQHAIVNSDSEVLTKAIVLTVDFIEQVKTPGFHGELPQ